MHKPTADFEDQSKELVSRLIKLKASLQLLQEYKGEIYGNLQGIDRELTFIGKRQNPNNENESRVLQSLEKIKKRTRQIENILTQVPADAANAAKAETYYKVKLRKILNFGILEVESETISLSVQFKGRLFEILEELIKKYVGDSKTDVPIEFRGYVNRKKLEKRLYGKYVGRNRLNSHITRIRSILIENGLTDASFIKSMDDFLRLNITSDDVTITTISTE